MQTMPKAKREDLMSQTAERVDQKYAEKFRQQCIDRWHEEQAKKGQKDRAIEKPVSSIEPDK